MDDGPGLNHHMVVLDHVYPISGNDMGLIDLGLLSLTVLSHEYFL